jgi:ribosomal protein S18 acetylase RimI-like enzyme
METLIREGCQEDKMWVLDVLVREWHGPLIERADEFVDASNLPCLIAEANGIRVGLATLLVQPDFIEIITLNSFQEGQGIGTALIAAAVEMARRHGASDVRLFTTNDNLHALGFYQRQGFILHALHRDTITRARLEKPEIPKIGRSGIPLRDEIELRLRL